MTRNILVCIVFLVFITILLGLYRIAVVDDFAKVIWKGPMDRKYNVSLLYKDEHFDGLKSIALYFKHKKFCIGLEVYLKIFWDLSFRMFNILLVWFISSVQLHRFGFIMFFHVNLFSTVQGLWPCTKRSMWTRSKLQSWL